MAYGAWIRPTVSFYASVGMPRAKMEPRHKSHQVLNHVVDHAACRLSQAASTLSRGQERPGLMDRRGTPA
jgi:hypothetical protein